MHQIEQLLRETIGLDASTVGATLIERAARSRMKAIGFTDTDAYLTVLKDLPEELDALIEAVVVTETWFFRDEEPFKIFARMVFGEWMPRQRTEDRSQRSDAGSLPSVLRPPPSLLRVASIPCSTGEEPYSIAMTLLDAGLTPQQFLLDAVDVSEQALERARLGVYGKNSFRGKSLEFRERHFTTTPHGAVLNANVRDCVRFHRANLLDPAFPDIGVTYHFIFCRNLLIYLDPAAQEKVFARLKQLLAPDGVVFLGPAELPIAVANGFVSTNIPMAFACRKASPVSMSKVSKKSTPCAVSAGATVYEEPPSLEKARRLADAGRLQEAAEICQFLLHTHPPPPGFGASGGASATAFYLLGLARDASGDVAQAESCFRKVLYLEPNHQEALSQMIALAQKKGDTSQVRVFQRRARRVLLKKGVEA